MSSPALQDALDRLAAQAVVAPVDLSRVRRRAAWRGGPVGAVLVAVATLTVVVGIWQAESRQSPETLAQQGQSSPTVSEERLTEALQELPGDPRVVSATRQPARELGKADSAFAGHGRSQRDGLTGEVHVGATGADGWTLSLTWLVLDRAVQEEEALRVLDSAVRSRRDTWSRDTSAGVASVVAATEQGGWVVLAWDGTGQVVQANVMSRDPAFTQPLHRFAHALLR